MVMYFKCFGLLWYLCIFLIPGIMQIETAATVEFGSKFFLNLLVSELKNKCLFLDSLSCTNQVHW